MARITLQQQWDDLKKRIDAYNQEQIDKFFETNEKPERLFRCYGFGGKVGVIEEIELTGFMARYKGDRGIIFEPYPPQKVTSRTLAELQEYFDTIQKLIPEILIKYKDVYVRTCGSYTYDEHLFAFDPSELEEKSKELKEKYAPREGYKPCAYCGKQVPESEMIQAKIIGRGRKTVWNSWKKRYDDKAVVTEDYFKFCSPDCAANEQMGREG